MLQVCMSTQQSRLVSFDLIVATYVRDLDHSYAVQGGTDLFFDRFTDLPFHLFTIALFVLHLPLSL